MDYYAIIVAGGIGSRMGGDLPKQFIELNSKPILVHTIEKFLRFHPEMQMVIVIHPGMKNHLDDLLKEYFPSQKFTVVHGGETRFHSVKNGLSAISSNEGIVGVHDAARPLVSISTLDKCYSTASSKGNACPVIEISESLRQISNGESTNVNRDEYLMVQTPQCFELSLLKKAFEQAYSPAFTDDASVLEKWGEKINLVEGNRENIKITYPGDVSLAEFLLKAHS